MADDGKATRAGRVLRFTVTSALVVAPLAGCSKSGEPPDGPHINTGPVEQPRYAPNPGPDELNGKPAPSAPSASASAAAADAGSPFVPSHPIANPVYHPVPDDEPGAPR